MRVAARFCIGSHKVGKVVPFKLKFFARFLG
jgi:hypothetical protein